PQDARPLLERAQAHAERGALDAAVADCSAALRVQPDLAPAHLLRATLHLAQRKGVEALADAERAAALAPADALPVLVRARARLLRNDAAGALSDARAAQRLQGGAGAYALGTLGMALTASGDAEGALQPLTEALRAAPLDPELWAERGRAHLALRRYRSAAADVDRAVALDPGWAVKLRAELEQLKSRRD
ncbi:MAG: hypothetical protein KF878_35535, partial [Planctomycetes bacterium]|nr:hypothetical protein [Planctomycetota bacterium]